MERGEYGPNGFRWLALGDYQTELANRNLDLELCAPAFVGLLGGFGLSVWIEQLLPDPALAWSMQLAALGMAALFVLQAIIGFHREAQLDGHMPSARGRSPQPDHITGFGALTVLAIVAVVAGVALAGEFNFGKFNIPEWVGFALVGLLVGLFLLVAVFPRLLDWSAADGVSRMVEWIGSPLKPLGRWLSRIDCWLIFVIAPTGGATLENDLLRYAVVTFHITGATLFAWYSGPPLGLIGTVWAVLLVISIIRRWALVESERDRAGRQQETTRAPLRISISQDLRNLAVWAMILLAIVLPMGIRQIYLASHVTSAFRVAEAVDDPLAWVGFFGVEVLKGLPLISWMDIYGAQSAARIAPTSLWAMHVVFGARVLVDLVFLAAVTEAVRINVSLARQRRRFLLNDGVDVLDERIERGEIERLVVWKNGRWEERPAIHRFEHYDGKRLHVLRRTAPKGSRLRYAVTRLFELKRLAYEPPSQQLAEAAREKKPDPKSLEAALDLVIEHRDFDLIRLRGAREMLNGKGNLEPIRKRVVQLIIERLPMSPERDAVLGDILQGSAWDTLAPVRQMVIDPLRRIYPHNNTVAEYLRAAAKHDRAGPVKARATAALRSLGLDVPAAETGQGLSWLDQVWLFFQFPIRRS